MPANEMYNPARRQREVPALVDTMFSCVFPPLLKHAPEEPKGMVAAFKGIPVRVIPEVRKIYFNNKHTTIEWADGTKTTVGCIEGQEFDEYGGFAAAVLKKLFGTFKAAIRCMDERKVVQPDPVKKEKKPKLPEAPVEAVAEETEVAQDA